MEKDQGSVQEGASGETGTFEREREMIGTDFLGKMDGNFLVRDDTKTPSDMGAFHSYLCWRQLNCHSV